VNEEAKYQRIYEDVLTDSLKDTLELPDRFYDLSHHQRDLVIQLTDAGFDLAIEESLDPAVLEETAALAAEMGTQLYSFANMLSQFLNVDDEKDEG
jgi:hypothetical protein